MGGFDCNCSGNRWNVKKPFACTPFKNGILLLIYKVYACLEPMLFFLLLVLFFCCLLSKRNKRSDCHFSILHSPSDAIDSALPSPQRWRRRRRFNKKLQLYHTNFAFKTTNKAHEINYTNKDQNSKRFEESISEYMGIVVAVVAAVVVSAAAVCCYRFTFPSSFVAHILALRLTRKHANDSKPELTCVSPSVAVGLWFYYHTSLTELWL